MPKVKSPRMFEPKLCAEKLRLKSPIARKKEVPPTPIHDCIAFKEGIILFYVISYCSLYYMK